MKKDNNYKVRVGLSIDSYTTKAEQNAAISSLQDARKLGLKRKMAFRDTEMSMTELLDRCINGYTFCHRFGNFTTPPKRTTYIRKDGAFTLAAKSDAFFIGSSLLCVDIDETDYSDLGTYIKSLEQQPSFWYTSFSNGQPGKGLRFRLVYVLGNEIDGKFFFRYCSEMLNRMIERSTGETIKDRCNLRCSQYFNGTNINTPGIICDFGITGNVYSLKEIAGCNFEDYSDWLCEQLEKPGLSEVDEERIYTELDIEQPGEEIYEQSDFKVSRLLYTDSIEKGYDDFQTHWRKKFSYIYRCEYDEIPWTDGYYKKVGDTYFQLYWNVKPLTDGQGRRGKLFERSCLRRLMKQDATADELYWNLIEDVYSPSRRMIDNGDGAITCRSLKRIAEKAMGMKLRDIVEKYSDNIEYLMKTTRPKDGIILNTKIDGCMYRGTEAGKYGHKKARAAEYKKNAESGLSIEENLKRLEEKGLKICRKTEYNIRKAAGEVNSIASDEELFRLVDPEKSIRANQKDLQARGIHVGRKRLGEILSELPKTPMEEEVAEIEDVADECTCGSDIMSFSIPKMNFFENDTTEVPMTPTIDPETIQFPKIPLPKLEFLLMWPLEP